MPGLVVDASVTLAWALPGEVRAEEATTWLLRVADQGAVVPAHWHLETGNALLMAERRGRIRAGRADAVWHALDAMPIETDAQTSARAWTDAAALARRHGLTLYDAAYLELAVRRALPLASFDTALVRAAVSEAVAVLGVGGG